MRKEVDIFNLIVINHFDLSTYPNCQLTIKIFKQDQHRQSASRRIDVAL